MHRIIMTMKLRPITSRTCSWLANHSSPFAKEKLQE